MPASLQAARQQRRRQAFDAQIEHPGRRCRATGSYATGGYLPPCSGGGGHVYFADIKAVNKVEGEDPRVLAETRFLLGRY